MIYIMIFFWGSNVKEKVVNMKITGLKKAVGEYQRANKEGYYSPKYGYLMFDKTTGELWTDEFYSLGHNEWKQYQSNSIINLGRIMTENNIEINMKNVKSFIEQRIA